MASKSKKLRKLQTIYNKVPAVQCKGKCTDECSLIPMTELEAGFIKELSIRPVEFDTFGGPPGHVTMVPRDGKLSCPMLVRGRCSIYEARPMICRLFGVAQGISCPEGCKPIHELTKNEAQELIRAVTKIR